MVFFISTLLLSPILLWAWAVILNFRNDQRRSLERPGSERLRRAAPMLSGAAVLQQRALDEEV